MRCRTESLLLDFTTYYFPNMSKNLTAEFTDQVIPQIVADVLDLNQMTRLRVTPFI
jgi:hypothetical protein